MVCIAPGQFISGPTGPPVCMLWGSKFPKRNIDVLLPGKKGRKQSGSNSHCVCHKGPACSKQFQPPCWPTSQDSQHTLLPLLYPSSVPQFPWFMSCSLWDPLPAYICMFLKPISWKVDLSWSLLAMHRSLGSTACGLRNRFYWEKGKIP